MSDFRDVLGCRGASQAHTIEILAAMGIMADDRPPVFDTWLSGKLDGLAPAIAVQARASGSSSCATAGHAAAPASRAPPRPT